MEVISGAKALIEATAVTLGNFDGLHLGHLKLINRLIDLANKINGKSLVYVIEKENMEKIMTREQKVCALDALGVDYVVFRKFSKEFKNIKAEDFLKELKDKFNVSAAVVGDDYRFGKDRQGNITSFKKFFEVDVVERVDDVSSTKIRDLIQQGDVFSANELLGWEFCIEGKVMEGLKNGRKIGFKTANITKPVGMIIPKVGVYRTRTKYNDMVYDSITNIGTNPTIGSINYKSIETNIFDFDEDIYGKRIAVKFLERIRGERKFGSIEDLAQQINQDVKKIREGK
ncbi:MAG: bifunctional riboflavin kinase/FAD synthetase [Clostridiales bacterium]|nr:bifunctional riboflavin kinase/FAD synthetase [Clostridiales bacterium]